MLYKILYKYKSTHPSKILVISIIYTIMHNINKQKKQNPFYIKSFAFFAADKVLYINLT